MPIEVFVDESIRADYLLAAVAVEVRQLTTKRTALRNMLLRGERRMHFSKETTSRRRELLGRLAREGFHVSVFVCSAPVEAARGLLLDAIVVDAGPSLHRLVIESRSQDDVYDVQRLVRLRASGILPVDATYDHMLPHEEPLLWVADAVGWAWGAKGDWRRRVDPLVSQVVRLDP